MVNCDVLDSVRSNAGQYISGESNNPGPELKGKWSFEVLEIHDKIRSETATKIKNLP